MANTHKLEGFVYNYNSLPQADRVVRAYRRDYGTLLGEATTGNGNVVPADEHYNNVSLLLRFDGLNGETTTTDLSPTPKTVTFNGNAALSNVQKKYGETSCYFDGLSDYLSIPYSADFNLPTDFTIEAWVYLAGDCAADVTGNRSAVVACFGTQATGNINYWWLQITGNTTTTGTGIFFEALVSGVSYMVNVTVTVNKNAWNHIAVTRVGSSVNIFLNGKVQPKSTNTLTNHSITGMSGNPLTIGSSLATNYFRRLWGYVSDFRITKGVARYTANFTPPTLTYPLTTNAGNLLGKFTIPTDFTGETYVVVLPHETEVTNMKVKDRVVPVLA